MLPAPLPSSGQDLSAACRFHSRPEAMRFGALPFLRLVCPFRHIVGALQCEHLRMRPGIAEYKCTSGRCQGFPRRGDFTRGWKLMESGRCAKIRTSKT